MNLSKSMAAKIKKINHVNRHTVFRVQIQDLVLDYRFQFNNNKIAWNVEICFYKTQIYVFPNAHF